MATTPTSIDTGPRPLSWTVYAGDTNRHEFSLGDGDPYDLTGAIITCQARVKASDPAVVATAAITPINLAVGSFAVAWDGDELRTALAGAEKITLRWDLQIELAGEIRTVYAGPLNVVHDVTRA